MISRLKSIIGLAVLVLGLACCVSSADDDVEEPAVGEVHVTQSESGGQVQLVVGDVLVVTLDSNPTTGYSWQVSRVDEGVLRQEGSAQFIPESDAMGSGGVEILRFEAVAAGSTELQLIYHRPWEEGVEPLEVFSLRVVVQ